MLKSRRVCGPVGMQMWPKRKQLALFEARPAKDSPLSLGPFLKISLMYAAWTGFFLFPA
jgi:hypothetical protein